MSKDSKEIIQIASKFIVKTFLHDDLQPGQHDRAWEDGRMYLMMDPDNEAVIAHGGIDRVIVEYGTIIRAFEEGFCNQKPRTLNRGRSRLEVTVIVNEDSNDVRIYAKLSGVGRDSKLPEGRAVHVTGVSQIGRCLDIQKLCLPLAGRAYRGLRNALYGGDASDIDTVERGLTNRLEQLSFIGRCKHEGVRDMLKELLAIGDAFFESVADMPHADQAIELGRQYIDGGSTLTAEIQVVAEAARALLAEAKARKSRAIVTVADVLEEKERLQRRRKELQAKRAKRAAAHAPISVEDAANKIVTAMGLDPNDDDLSDLDEAPADSAETESGEADDREAEGSPEAESSSEKAAPRVSARAQRMLDEAEARRKAGEAGETPVTTAPEAPKPKETESKKVEAPKLDWKAKLGALKQDAGTETAPAADVAPAAESDKSE